MIAGVNGLMTSPQNVHNQPIQPPQPQRKSNALIYAALIAVSAIGPLALNMFMPSIPGLVTDLNTTAGMAQLTLTLYLIGTAVSQLVYGPLSDRFGRRPILLGGLVIFIFATIVCAYAPTIEILVAARLLQSFGGAAGMVLSRAIIRDLHEERAAASVIGYITMAWALAPMVAPVIGGYLDQYYSWRASFWLLTALGLFALALAALLLPETNQTTGAKSGESRLSAYQRLFTNKRFIGLVATLSFSTAVFFSFLGGAPFLTINYLGLTTLDYGTWYIIISLGYVAGNFIAGRMSQKLGTNTMIVGGMVISIAGATLAFVAAMSGQLNAALFFYPMAIIALGNGITLPNAMSATLSADPKAIGSAAGLAGFIQSMVGATAAQIVGIAQTTTPLIVIWFMFFGAILAGLSYWLIRREPSTPDTP